MKTNQAETTLAACILATRIGQCVTLEDNVGTVITGEGIRLLRHLTILRGLRLEVKVPGMRLTRGVSCLALAKAEYGLKGTRPKVLEQLEALHVRANAIADAAARAAA